MVDPISTTIPTNVDVTPWAIAARLRGGDPPVVGRITDGVLLLDARTVLPGEDAALIAAVAAASKS